MLEKWFVQPIVKLSVSRNAYGDYVTNPTGNVTMYCRIRDYSEGVRFNPTTEEQRLPQLQAWFKPTENVQENDIFLYEGKYYEVTRVREARRGRSNTIEFLKVSLSAHVMVS